MLNFTPLVTIGIPCYNASKYIRETLDSIANQCYPNIELVIVDDCSIDNSVQIIQEWINEKKIDRVIFEVNNENLGVVKTANKILNLAKGDYFQLLGCDDILFSEKTHKQVALLENSPADVCMVFSDVMVIDEKGQIISESYFKEQGITISINKERPIFEKLLAKNFIPTPSVLIRTDCLRNVGNYDETLGFEDLDMWLRLSLNYTIICLPETLAAYRRLPASMIHNINKRAEIQHSQLLCYEKYWGYSEVSDSIIRSHIIRLAPSIYRLGHPKGKYWVKKRFRYDKSLKSLIYYFFSVFDIPFFWQRL